RAPAGSPSEVASAAGRVCVWVTPLRLAVVQGGMRRIDLAYGRRGLSVELDAGADVIEPRYVPGLADEVAAIRDALRAPVSGPPLWDLVKGGSSVGISVCDVTRPFPGR